MEKMDFYFKSQWTNKTLHANINKNKKCDKTK